jgi:regulator of protease activity HflC (stomatin/prohibitin superfamily)
VIQGRAEGGGSSSDLAAAHDADNGRELLAFRRELDKKYAAREKKRAAERAERERKEREQEREREARARANAERLEAEERKRFIDLGGSPDMWKRYWENVRFPEVMRQLEQERERDRVHIRDYL